MSTNVIHIQGNNLNGKYYTSNKELSAGEEWGLVITVQNNISGDKPCTKKANTAWYD